MHLIDQSDPAIRIKVTYVTSCFLWYLLQFSKKRSVRNLLLDERVFFASSRQKKKHPSGLLALTGTSSDYENVETFVMAGTREFVGF